MKKKKDDLKVQFGFGMINKATPLYITRIKKGLYYISGVSLISSDYISGLFHSNPANLGQLIGLFIVVVNFVGSLFGVEITADTVPTTDVTEVDTSNRN